MAKKTTRTSVYFKDCKTVDEITAKYSDLTLFFSDDADTLIEISKEFDEFFTILRDEHNKGASEYKQIGATAEELRGIFEQLRTFKDAEKDLDLMRDCKVTLKGTWIWVGAADGKDAEITRNYRNFLKQLGFFWNDKKNRKVWQWHSPHDKRIYRPKQKELIPVEEVDEKYGSRVITAAAEI